tara:strand:- start:467 stop:1123 length:657 start_codon:yes stop_codon:yes gene_type:complete
MAGIVDLLTGVMPGHNRNKENMILSNNGAYTDPSIRGGLVGALTQGPVASSLKVLSDPDISGGRKVGAGLFGLGAGAAGLMGGGPIGILGGILNGMGAYHDVGDQKNFGLIGDLTYTPSGTLYGDTPQPGGSFYQSGNLNNQNTLTTAPESTMVNNAATGQRLPANELGWMMGGDSFRDGLLTAPESITSDDDYAGTDTGTEDDNWGGWDWGDDSWSF